MGMGKTWRDFVPTGNGYEITPMGNPMDTQKKITNENNSYNMWG